MDITETLAPKSDQQNYDDYIAGARTVTVTGGKVLKGSEQPLHIDLAEYPGRPFKPNKSMRRVLAIAWGTETDAYIGRRLKLVGNPNVKYGGKAVGGIEIEAMSNLDKPLNISLTETRGKKRSFTVQPLPDVAPPTTPARDWKAEADNLAGNVEALRSLYMDAQANGATPDTLTHIQNKAQEPTE